MKALDKNSYTSYEVSKVFNGMILSHIGSYDGSKKKQLKSFLEDLQKGGCISGMIGEFIYHDACREFYIKHLDDLENIKNDLEESLGEPIANRFQLPHYTFLCWLCFEEYCYDIYRNSFE
jgi:hypothetical protein